MRHCTANLTFAFASSEVAEDNVPWGRPEFLLQSWRTHDKSFLTSAAFPLGVIYPHSHVRPSTSKISILRAWRQGGARPVTRHRNSHTHSAGHDRDPRVRPCTIKRLYAFFYPFLATLSRKAKLYSY